MSKKGLPVDWKFLSMKVALVPSLGDLNDKDIQKELAHCDYAYIGEQNVLLCRIRKEKK